MKKDKQTLISCLPNLQHILIPARQYSVQAQAEWLVKWCFICRTDTQGNQDSHKDIMSPMFFNQFLCLTVTQVPFLAKRLCTLLTNTKSYETGCHKCWRNLMTWDKILFVGNICFRTFPRWKIKNTAKSKYFLQTSPQHIRFHIVVLQHYCIIFQCTACYRLICLSHRELSEQGCDLGHSYSVQRVMLHWQVWL